MKKLLCWILCFTLLMVSAGCHKAEEYKNKIFHLVTDHKDFLLADIESRNFANALSLDGIEEVTVLAPCIDFYCGGYGISVSSHEFGFYYSFADRPLGVWEGHVFATEARLTPDGSGFSGTLDGNFYYTEHICDHFWYYELHF